ncbi:MAG: DUF2892 domain-containing protein [Ferruginibacter sp.]
MKSNVGKADKMIRLLLAAALLGLYFGLFSSEKWGIALPILAAVMVLTSFISFCPLYTIFGINTNKNKK